MTRILNLYSGLGGNRVLWDDCEVTAVEENPELGDFYQNKFPHDRVIIGDAHQYLLDHYHEYDFIWSSPPCQTHTQLHLTNSTKHRYARYPDMALYQEIIFLQTRASCGWVIENVIPHYKPLIPAMAIGRHLFWSNYHIGKFPKMRMIGIFKTKNDDRSRGEMIDQYQMHGYKNVYLKGSHDPLQPLRNCVHPALGAHILKEYRAVDLFGGKKVLASSGRRG